MEILGLPLLKAVTQLDLGEKIKKNERADEATENKYASHFSKFDLFFLTKPYIIHALYILLRLVSKLLEITDQSLNQDVFIMHT